MKKRHALIQFADGEHHRQMLTLSRPIHNQYCATHDIDFLDHHDVVNDGRTQHWQKIRLMLEAADNGYEKIAWLDSDCVIVNHDFNLMSATGFGIAVCECFDSPNIQRHLNTGVVICTNSSEVRDFLSLWDRTPRQGDVWQDQSAFIELMKERPNRDLLTVLPNRFNCVETHMEARDPIIRHFAGDHGGRLAKVEALIGTLRCGQP